MKNNSCDKTFEIGERVQHTDTKRVGFVVASYTAINRHVYVRFDGDNTDLLCLVVNLKKVGPEKPAFKKGDRVEVIGISGEGEVVQDSGELRTLVRWSDGGETFVLASNLRLVRGAPKLQDVITVLEAERRRLMSERETVNSKILDIEGAIKLIKRAE